jgi:hypothetical protein
MPESRVVSISLFGDKKKYLLGAEKMLQSVTRNLPDWRVVFFVGKSVPQETREKLVKRGANLVHVDEVEDLSATAWRFRISQLGETDFVIFRDSDSMISKREAQAIRQWTQSGLEGHIIRDHPLHFAKIMAGLWGARTASISWLEGEAKMFAFNDKYGSDQEFLATKVYPRIVDSCLIHASFHKHEKGPNSVDFKVGSSRIGVFCGESATSTFLQRLYARGRRLFDPKECNCVI